MWVVDICLTICLYTYCDPLDIFVAQITGISMASVQKAIKYIYLVLLTLHYLQIVRHYIYTQALEAM
jgi:hypothetical protein